MIMVLQQKPIRHFFILIFKQCLCKACASKSPANMIFGFLVAIIVSGTIDILSLRQIHHLTRVTHCVIQALTHTISLE